MKDSSRALWVLEKLRPILAKYPHHPYFRYIKFWALAASGAPVSTLTALTDSLVKGRFPSGSIDPPGRLQQAHHCLELAQVLLARRESLSTAESYARRAIGYVEPTQPLLRTTCEDVLARIREAGVNDSVLRAHVAAPHGGLDASSNSAAVEATDPGAGDGNWWSSLIKAAIAAGPGAFMGAFAAFLFYRLGDFVLDRYRRKQRHHSALVRLEGVFNDYHDRLRILAKRIKEFQDAAAKGAVHRGSFRALDIDGNALLELLDLKLINALFRLNARLRSVNADLADLYGAYCEIKDAYIGEHGSPQAIDLAKANLNAIATKTATEMMPIKREIEALLPVVQRMHAWIRLQAHRDLPRMWIAVNTPRIAKLSDQEIDQENAKLGREMEESVQESRKRRKEIHGESG